MSDRAARFMREQTFNRNLVVSGNVLRDGRLRYRMQDGTVFRLTEKDLETLDRYQFKPRFVDKAYYAITFRDVPEDYILGGSCLACAHVGPVNRFIIERRWSKDENLRFVDDYLRCTACGNKHHNRFTVYGRRLRMKAALPAGIEDDAPR